LRGWKAVQMQNQRMSLKDKCAYFKDMGKKKRARLGKREGKEKRRGKALLTKYKTSLLSEGADCVNQKTTGVKKIFKEEKNMEKDKQGKCVRLYDGMGRSRVKETRTERKTREKGA